MKKDLAQYIFVTSGMFFFNGVILSNYSYRVMKKWNVVFCLFEIKQLTSYTIYRAGSLSHYRPNKLL